MGGRRLTAILAADIAGYSALMGANEVDTLAALKGHQSAIFPLIGVYDGRIIDTAGDGILAEFASVYNAVKCAIAIQEIMTERNASVAPDRRMQFRIGINQGDVLFDENSRIFGDGINVAARLELICEPGSICISRKVYEEVKHRFEIHYSDIGEQTLKNIAEPVHAYLIKVSGTASSAAPATDPRPLAAPRSVLPRLAAIAAAAVALVTAVAAVLWSQGWHFGSTTLEERLAGVLAAAVPQRAVDKRRSDLEAYLAGRHHRAFAVAPKAHGVWRTHGWGSRLEAEEKVLERCQMHYDEACGLVAADNDVVSNAIAANLAVRSADRVRFSGTFTPDRLPGVAQSVRDRADVVGYVAARGPKASALHPLGVLRIVQSAVSQREAEAVALRGCNEEATQLQAGSGPCYLYAVDNRVVLPLRSTVPLTPEARTGSTTSLRDELTEIITRLAPLYTYRDEQVRLYLASAAHKALAVAPPGASWRVAGQESAFIAQERVLEACQVRHGKPCALVAVNDTLVDSVGQPRGLPRPMPRVSYAGIFDPAQVPAVAQATRERADIVGYRAAPGPKAVAIHPWGRLFVVTGAASQRIAEEMALAACNKDPDRDAKDGSCLLYAADNTVILPRRAIVPTASP